MRGTARATDERWRGETARALVRVAALVGALALCSLAPDAARAQGGVEDPFEVGVRAWDEQRYGDALESFLAAYERSGNPLVLFNVGAAQVELGRLAAAAETYQRALASDDPRVARHADVAGRALAEIEPRLAHLEIACAGLAAGDVVVVGERETGEREVGERETGEREVGERIVGERALGEGAIAERVLDVDAAGRAHVVLDAGAHAVSIRRGDEAIVSADVTLAEGERRTLELEAPRAVATVPTPEAAARASVAAPAPMLAEREREPSIAESPWLWVGVGAGLAVVAAIAIGVGVAASTPAQTYAGSFEPGTFRVR